MQLLEMILYLQAFALVADIGFRRTRYGIDRIHQGLLHVPRHEVGDQEDDEQRRDHELQYEELHRAAYLRERNGGHHISYYLTPEPSDGIASYALPLVSVGLADVVQLG